MAKKALPKEIYVYRDRDPNDPSSSWLTAQETPDGIEHGMTVAIYKLVETKRMIVTQSLK